MSKKSKFETNNLKISDEEYMKKKEVLASFFSDETYKLMTLKQIKGLFNIKKDESDIFENILKDLETDGIIYLDESKRYVPTKLNNIFKCEYDLKSSKFGFARKSNGEDIYILKEDSMSAMNKDIVLVKVIKQKNGDKNAEGQVIKIIERNTKFIVGRFTKSRNFGFVTPINKNQDDIYIPKKYALEYEDGLVVKIEILKYADKSSKAEGKIVQVIGQNTEKNIEVKALYASYDLENYMKFNNKVLEELEKIPDTVSKEEFLNREDKTKERVFTIDGDDAKDLDDGVCVKKLNDGNFLLSVFIADVSNYVKMGSAIDNEASIRGTSIYIPGTVIPMLPKKLSNGICSLNENVDRLALAIDMKIGLDGEVLESKVYKAVINVKKRMTYDKVFKVLTKKRVTKDIKDYEEFKPDLILMKKLALILNKKKKKAR